MKKIFYSCVLVTLLSAVVSCDEQYVTYNDAEYVMFSDSLSHNMVLADGGTFRVAVASTVACDYDRTFGVEVVDEGSNAIEGVHYRLRSNTITIPAGELSTAVEVQGLYDNITPTDSLGFVLRLVMPEQLKWDAVYPDSDRTKVVMYKSCPFDINNFTGPCVLTSLFLYNFPAADGRYQRLIETELHPTEENTIILRDALYDGYDLTIKFHPEDPANPLITMDSDQVLSDEASVLGWVLGDDHIRASHSAYYPSFFNSCQRFVELWMHIYVENVGEPVGTIGEFYNVLEWISEEEAEELRREGF